MDIFASEHVAWVPVLGDDRRAVGVVSTGDLIAAYRRSLTASQQNLRSISAGSVLVEGEVQDDARPERREGSSMI